MSGATRRLATLIVAALVCVLPFGSAQAAPGSDNIATAINQTDNTRVDAFAWDITRYRSDDPTYLNEARAEATCINCQATAIAFQIVIGSGPGGVVPVNVSTALNEQCTDCVAAAHARQFVRVVDERVRFTGDGRSTLTSVREELEAAQYLPIDEQYLVVEAQEARVRDVLNNELVVRGTRGKEPDVLQKRFRQKTDLIQ